MWGQNARSYTTLDQRGSDRGEAATKELPAPQTPISKCCPGGGRGGPPCPAPSTVCGDSGRRTGESEAQGPAHSHCGHAGGQQGPPLSTRPLSAMTRRLTPSLRCLSSVWTHGRVGRGCSPMPSQLGAGGPGACSACPLPSIVTQQPSSRRSVSLSYQQDAPPSCPGALGHKAQHSQASTTTLLSTAVRQ